MVASALDGEEGTLTGTVIVEDLCIVHNIRISFGFLVHLTCQLLSRHTNNIDLILADRLQVNRSPGGHRSWWHYV